MAITVKKRVPVTEEFIEKAIKRVAQLRLDCFKQNVIYQGKFYAKRHKSDIQYCLSIVNQTKTPGKGLDLEVTNLRALPYIGYGFGTLKDYGDFIFAQTGDVICTDLNTTPSRHNPNPIAHKWDCGSWMIVVPISAFENSSLTRIHVIPSRAQKERERHPHHYAHVPGSNNFRQNDPDMHPLLKEATTCWSGFATPLPMALERGCISEVFRIMYQFVSTYNSGSPLCHMDGLPHFIPIGASNES